MERERERLESESTGRQGGPGEHDLIKAKGGNMLPSAIAMFTEARAILLRCSLSERKTLSFVFGTGPHSLSVFSHTV